MSQWKLIACDMDGTLLLPDGSISSQTRELIAEARKVGIEVTLATGRHRLDGVCDVVDELGISVPFVTSNGGEVWTSSGELLRRQALRGDDIRWLRDVSRYYRTRHWSSTAETLFQPAEFPDDVTEPTWLTFVFAHDDHFILQEIADQLEQIGRFEVTNSSPLNLEVNPRSVHKASGLQLVCDKMGISCGQVVAVGDSLNDRAMVEWAGLGVAMGNAQARLKRVANQVTSTNVEHGVARLIQEILGGNGCK